MYSVVYLFYCMLIHWNWVWRHPKLKIKSHEDIKSIALEGLAVNSIKIQEYHHHPIGLKCSCSIWEVFPSKLVTSSLAHYQIVSVEARGTCSAIATISILVIYTGWALSQHDPDMYIQWPQTHPGKWKEYKKNSLYFRTNFTNIFNCIPCLRQWLKLKSTGWTWSRLTRCWERHH